MSKDPFLKWAGGKRWLVKQHSDLFPKFTGRYIEPFLGSGAVFFYLQPEQALLSDTNAELIETYKVVRDHPQELDLRLSRLQRFHSKVFYYQLRGTTPTTKIDRAARFIYLNRTCWNGLYRVNGVGQFNVPIGTKTKVKFPLEALATLSLTLKRAQLSCADFEIPLNKAKRNDFVFVDPPYTVLHNNNGFIKYNDVLFSWSDQKRLAESVRRASDRGAYVFVSNADHAEVADLYTGFVARILHRSSILSGKPGARRSTSEAAFLNYNPEQSLHSQ